MKIRCRAFGHDWRPDRIYLFGVCRRCGVPSDHPQPGQNDPGRILAILAPGKLITDPDEDSPWTGRRIQAGRRPCGETRKAGAQMSRPEPPAWVYDLVIDLLEQNETHPTLYFTSGAFEGYAKYDWCACTALEKVPQDVVEKAIAIWTYKRNLAEAT